MRQVAVAVVGLGFMGSRWARVLAEHPCAELRVVSDVRADIGRRVAADLGARFCPDPLEAAAAPGIEGVVVCTPEHVHVEPALAAIDGSRAVLVEKPLAHTVEAAARIRDRAAERGVPVLVGHILRFEPRYAAARRLIEEGEVGAVQAVHHERIGLVSDQEILRGRTSIALYYGVHELDLARWYVGEIDRLYAERSQGVLRALGYEVEDLYSAVVRFLGGAHGTIMVGWSLPSTMPGYGIGGVTVIGDEGVLRISQEEVGMVVVGRSGRRSLDVSYAPEVHGRLRGALAAEADHFLDCARGTAEPLCTAHDGTEAVRLALAMEESARSGRVARL